MTAGDRPAIAWPTRAHRSRADVTAAKAELLPELLRLAESVTRRTRLWRGERRDVLCELCAHFRDGLAEGRTTEELIRDFGDPKLAARLIRRGKKRCRPLAWRILRRTEQVVGLLLLLLIAHVAWMAFVARPTISVDYVAELNAPVLATPAEDRAWLLYRQVLAEMPKAPFEWRQLERDKPEWPQDVAWLEANAEYVERIRAAARLPTMGMSYTTDWEIPSERKLSGKDWLQIGEGPGEPGPLISALLPHLRPLRDLGMILRADAERAAGDGDNATAIEDIVGIAGLARQLCAGEVLIEQLVGYALAALASDTTIDLLHAEPTAWDHDELVRLAHGLAGQLPGGVPRLDLRSEKLFYKDSIQRVFTDSPIGGGRLIVRDLLPFSGGYDDGQAVMPGESLALQTVLGVLSAGREATRREFARTWEHCEAAYSLPLWDPRFGEWQDRFERRINTTWYRLRYPLLPIIMPSFERAAISQHGANARLDATLTAVAIDAYRLAHGDYPQRLADLVPAYLPAVPIDPWDGKPLKYRLASSGEQIEVRRDKNSLEPIALTAEDGFVLYSIGGDRIDDGGRVHQWKAWTRAPGGDWSEDRGDYVYWPPTKGP
jgi:hypothetical protein